MSETSERVKVSKAEGRGDKAYWIREAVRLADEVVAIEARLEAVRQVMYHSNDDTAGRLAKALGIIRQVQQEKQND